MKFETTNAPMPKRHSGLQKEQYVLMANQLELNQGIKTGDRTTTVGVLRALERLDRKGTQRTIDKELWVWRII